MSAGPAPTTPDEALRACIVCGAGPEDISLHGQYPVCAEHLDTREEVLCLYARSASKAEVVLLAYQMLCFPAKRSVADARRLLAKQLRLDERAGLIKVEWLENGYPIRVVKP